MEEKTPNEIKADKWVEAHCGDANETVKVIAHACYYAGLNDKEIEMSNGQAV